MVEAGGDDFHLQAAALALFRGQFARLDVVVPGIGVCAVGACHLYGHDVAVGVYLPVLALQNIQHGEGIPAYQLTAVIDREAIDSHLRTVRGIEIGSLVALFNPRCCTIVEATDNLAVGVAATR